MKKRSLRNGAIVVVTLGALTGVGTMVANAATGPGGGPGRDDRGGAAAGQRNDVPFDPDVSPSPFDPTVSPSPFDPNRDPNDDPNGDRNPDPSFDPSLDPSAAPGQAANTNACVDVGDNGRLCTAVEVGNQHINRVRVTLTVPAQECPDQVTLQADTDQGTVRTQTVDCDNGRAAATFDTNQQIANGSQVCGILAGDDRLRTARACVRL